MKPIVNNPAEASLDDYFNSIRDKAIQSAGFFMKNCFKELFTTTEVKNSNLTQLKFGEYFVPGNAIKKDSELSPEEKTAIENASFDNYYKTYFKPNHPVKAFLYEKFGRFQKSMDIMKELFAIYQHEKRKILAKNTDSHTIMNNTLTTAASNTNRKDAEIAPNPASKNNTKPFYRAFSFVKSMNLLNTYNLNIENETQEYINIKKFHRTLKR